MPTAGGRNMWWTADVVPVLHDGWEQQRGGSIFLTTEQIGQKEVVPVGRCLRFPVRLLERHRIDSQLSALFTDHERALCL